MVKFHDDKKFKIWQALSKKKNFINMKLQNKLMN